MQQELLLNIIPFDPPTGKQKFAFYKQKQADFYPVFKDDLQGLLDDELSGLKRNNSSPAGKIITTNNSIRHILSLTLHQDQYGIKSVLNI